MHNPQYIKTLFKVKIILYSARSTKELWITPQAKQVIVFMYHDQLCQHMLIMIIFLWSSYGEMSIKIYTYKYIDSYIHPNLNSLFTLLFYNGNFMIIIFLYQLITHTYTEYWFESWWYTLCINGHIYFILIWHIMVYDCWYTMVYRIHTCNSCIYVIYIMSYITYVTIMTIKIIM